MKAPVVFVSHGAPLFALEPGKLGPELAQLGSTLGKVKAILVVSAHWISRGTIKVSTAAQQETIHDFGGFPAPLYQLQYPAQGEPLLAREAIRLLNQAGIPAEKDAQRGLDHGAWVPLYHMLPDANIPVFQVSLPATFDAATALALGKALAPLREQGVLILASGSMTHNLYEFRQRGSHAEPYVHAFADWVREHVKANDVDLLLNYRALAPEAQRAHPTPDHFLPLFVAIGAQSEDEPLQVLGDEVTYGVLSMESYTWGAARLA